MRRIAFVVVIVACLVSCKKDKPAPPTPPSPPPTTVINHTALNPVVSITSVHHFTTQPYSDCIFPVPADSSASIVLDIDGDAVSDFRVTLTHSLTGGGCNHCSNRIRCAISVVSVHPNALILSKVNYNRPGALYLKGDSISNAYSGSSNASLFVYECTGSPLADDKYCGVMVNGKVGWFYLLEGSSFKVTIQSFAINIGSSGLILAGQKS